MKMLLILFFLVSSVGICSESVGNNNFEIRKSNLLNFFNEKLTHFQEAKKCVEEATDDAALTKCHDEMQKRNIEYRKGNLDKRIRRLQERRDRLNK